MAISVGDGRSVDSMPDYAAQYGQIQQGLAHKFDQYTNPFLLAKGIQDTTLPFIQQQDKSSYERASLNLDQQRQDLAKTQQDTLLPLQAQSIGVETDRTRAQGALMSWQLGQQQNAYGQMPAYLNDLATAQSSADPAAMYSAASKNPAAALANPSVFNDSLNRLSQSQAIVNSGITGSAAAQGGDYVSQNPGATLDDITSSYTPTQGLTPAQQLSEKNAYLLGATHTQSQIKTQEVQGALKMAATKYRTDGYIDAATIKTIGPLIKSGRYGPEVLAGFGIDPEASAGILAAVNGTPDANGNIVPDKIAAQNIRAATAIINAKVPATTDERNWAHSVINNNGTAAFQIPVYSGPVQDQIDTLTTQIGNLQNSLPQRSTSSLFGESAYDTTNNQIKELQNQLNDIKNNNDLSRGASGQRSAPRPTFGQNRFLPQNGPLTLPYNPQASGPDESPAPVVPGNPLTTNALDDAGVGGNPKGQIDVTPSTPSVAPIPNNVKGLPIPREQIQPAIDWLKANPNDPRAPGIRAKLKASGVKGL